MSVMNFFVPHPGVFSPVLRGPARQAGFNLVEILTAVTVFAILGGLALQAGQLLRREMTSSEVNDLMASLSYARSTAIKTRQTITVCKSDDGQRCGRGASWDGGWITFVDQDRDRIVDPEDRLLRVHEALPAGSRLRDGSGYFYYVMFKPDGSGWPNATFTFCGPAGYRRAIILYRTGRARVSARSSGRTALDCSLS
jgi:type IV fimbrial biogenesis protein FimT